MFERYTSEWLLRELPRPLLNFLWYLWDTYYDPCDPEFQITLQEDGNDAGDANRQRVIIPSTGATVTQNFGCSVNAEIVIRKCGTRVFMEYD